MLELEILQPGVPAAAAQLPPGGLSVTSPALTWSVPARSATSA